VPARDVSSEADRRVGIDAEAIAPQVDGKFMNAVRARKPATA